MDSVAPEVHTISSGPHFKYAANCSRASAKARSARAPSRCGLEGFPTNCSLASSHASRAEAHSGVVALWSKYSMGTGRIRGHGWHSSLLWLASRRRIRNLRGQWQAPKTRSSSSARILRRACRWIAGTARRIFGRGRWMEYCASDSQNSPRVCWATWWIMGLR